jgi:AcrR family transcriptional regulator
MQAEVVVAEAWQSTDFEPKKRPVQRRSRETFEALVEACTWLLPRRGYAGTTTNHIAERAGTSIASLYEYFPNKDAIVAQVAERMVARILDRLGADAVAVGKAPEEDAIRLWIERIHDTIRREGDLIAVFVYQVPYTNRLDAIRAVSGRLMAFSLEMQKRAGGRVRREISPERMQLAVNLVTSTILQLVVEPFDDRARRALLDELAARVEEWLR